MTMLVTDEEFLKAWEKLKSATKVAEFLGMKLRSVQARRRSLEGKHGIRLGIKDETTVQVHDARVNITISDGTALVFSDAHYWTTIPTTAHKALLHFIKLLKPKLVVCNGDAFDGASISRHPRGGFLEHRPSVIEELKACQEMLDQVSITARAACKSVQLTWPLGNHDSRFEAFLAAQAPQYEFVQGFHLKDHFPEWKPCWSTWVNGDTVIKHRWKGGIHATHNNTLNAGLNFVTGHLHSLKVSAYTDYNGTRYGVDTGTLAEVYGEQFMYIEDNPRNWRSGFAVLTFKDGELLPPEVVTVIRENVVAFRGELYTF